MSLIAEDETIFALERRARDLAAAWNRALLLAEAEAACSAVLQDPDADDAAKDAAEARENFARAEADRVGETVDELARRICATPAETLAGVACKAQVALWLEMDGPAELVLRPCPLSGRTPWLARSRRGGRGDARPAAGMAMSGLQAGRGAAFGRRPLRSPAGR